MNPPDAHTDSPLYAAYRQAVLNRNDEEALKVMQDIARVNPADANAAAELARLDAKVLAAKLQHLAGSLDGAQPALLVAEIEAIEAFGFKTKPEGEVWRKAQTVRCEFLLEEAARHKEASRWLEALGKIELVQRLQAEFKLELPATTLAKLDALETWARGEQENDKKNREFQSLLGELRQQIQQSEEKDTSARYVQLPELRDDFEALHKVWRSLTDFTRPIPDEFVASFQKRSALLETEIARRTAIRRGLIVGGSILVLSVAALIAWLVIGQMKAHEFDRQLRAAVAQRQVHTADRLLERAHAEKIGRAEVVALAESFSAREHALLAVFEATYGKLPPRLLGEPDSSRLGAIADQLAQAQAALAALAPDLKAENEPRVQAFEKQWQDYLSNSSSTVNGLLDYWISGAEKQAGELDYNAPVAKTSAQVDTLASLMWKIAKIEAGFTNDLALRSDLLDRTAVVQAKCTAYQGELKKLDDGLAAVQKAGTTKEFSDGINLMASSEFSTSPLAAAAAVVQSLNANEDTILRALLGATNAGTRAYIAKAHGRLFVPEAVMPAERQIFQQLKGDPAVSAIHQRYRLWLDPQGSDVVEWIVAGPAFVPEASWRKILAWTVSPTATTAVFDERDCGYFDGQYRLSPTRFTYRLDKLDQPDETAAFSTVGLDKVWTGGDTYSQPLLGVLDAIKDSTNGSPLFRAYLFLRVMDVMEFQPDAWGLSFCPAARAHREQIENIAGELNSGDWFVPAKAAASSKPLEEFFASVRGISYAKQAAGLLTLAQAVSRNGLKYAGFVGLDGKPHFIDGSMAGEVYGYSAASKKPVLLAAKMQAGEAPREPALALSPLFALESPRLKYLAAAQVDPADESFRGTLPPLFQGVVQP